MKHKFLVLINNVKGVIHITQNFGIRYGAKTFVCSIVLCGNKSKAGRKWNKRIYDELIKKYADEFIFLLDLYRIKDTNFMEHKIARNSFIWVFWWQGIENAPEIVKLCYQSIQEHAGLHEIKLISKENYGKYIKLPSYIIEKLHNEQITLTHFSDILRLALLSEYGGIWMDATLWMIRDFPEDMYTLPFYTLKHMQYSDYHVSRGKWSGFFLASVPNNPFMEFSRDFLYEYWKKENLLICYLLIDVAFCVAVDNMIWADNLIENVSINNQAVFSLQSNMNKIFNQQELEKWNAETFVYKLSYKIPFQKTSGGKDTFYSYFIQKARRSCIQNNAWGAEQ